VRFHFRNQFSAIFGDRHLLGGLVRDAHERAARRPFSPRLNFVKCGPFKSQMFVINARVDFDLGASITGETELDCAQIWFVSALKILPT